MLKTILVLLLLFISVSNLFGENIEPSKNLLHAQKVDEKNYELGKSISSDVRQRWVEKIYSSEGNNYMVFSGLEFLNSSIEEKKIIRNFRAYADISYYSEAQIQEVREFISKAVTVLCKENSFRQNLFLFDVEIIIRVLDKVNNLFIDISLNKSVCSNIEPYGRYRPISKRDIRKLREGPETEN